MTLTNGALTHSVQAPDVSVVIVSWNTRDLLAECLLSVAQTPVQQLASDSTQVLVDGLRCEIVVVDNASRDGTPEMLRESFPWVRLIANTENIGFARANNQAFRLSRGRYLLMLNPDTCTQPGALRTLFNFMQKNPRTGAAGARIIDPDGSLQLSCYPAPTLLRELWRLFHLDALYGYACYDMEHWRTDRAHRADTILGACMLVPRQAVEEVGPLDEDFFIYSEEVDLCLRLRQRGWDVAWVPQATVMHYGGQSTRQVATEMFLRLYAAKVLYFRKHQGGMAASIYKLILGIAALSRILVLPLCLVEQGKRRHDHSLLSSRYRELVKALPAF